MAAPSEPLEKTVKARYVSSTTPRVYFNPPAPERDATPSVPLSSDTIRDADGQPSSADGIFFGTHYKEDDTGPDATPSISGVAAAALAGRRRGEAGGRWVGGQSGFRYVRSHTHAAEAEEEEERVRRDAAPEVPDGLDDGGHFAQVISPVQVCVRACVRVCVCVCV